MSRPKLQHCLNGCCFFIDGKVVTQPKYEAALQQHQAFETISVCYQLKPRPQAAIHVPPSNPHRREQI